MPTRMNYDYDVAAGAHCDKILFVNAVYMQCMCYGLNACVIVAGCIRLNVHVSDAPMTHTHTHVHHDHITCNIIIVRAIDVFNAHGCVMMYCHVLCLDYMRRLGS